MPNCACTIVGNNCDRHIKFCKLHAFAGELLRAAEELDSGHYIMDGKLRITFKDLQRLQAAIKKASS